MICVFGSIDVDLVCRTAKIARPSETGLSSRYDQYPGGKGANQAVAAARVGGQVEMIGAIGGDDFGDMAKAGLVNNGGGIAGVAEDPPQVHRQNNVGQNLVRYTVTKTGISYRTFKSP